MITTSEEENYFVTFNNEDGTIESDPFSTLPLARQAGKAHQRSGSFVSITNKKGIKLPL